MAGTVVFVRGHDDWMTDGSSFFKGNQVEEQEGKINGRSS